MRSFATMFLALVFVPASPAPPLPCPPVQTRPVQTQPLQPGDAFPEISAQTLTGQPIDLPAAVTGKPAAVVFAFTRAGGHDARAWSERILRDNPQLPVYSVIELESVPSLFRGMAVSGIRSSMPAPVQSRAIVLFRDERLWRARLAVHDANQAVVVLLAAGGRVRVTADGPFGEAAYAQFQSHVSDAR